MYTLTYVFNKEKDKVLMCWHKKFDNLNGIGGKVNELEQPMDASYRELFEETGIRREDVDLHFVRHEAVTSMAPNNGGAWEMFVTAGVLKHNVELIPEENELFWIPIIDKEEFINGTGNGNQYVFLREAVLIVPELKGIKI